MYRIEADDLSRSEVLALIEEHLRNMHELTPPGQVFAFDASKLRAPGVVLWTAWQDGTLLGCAALKELSLTQGEVKSMRTPSNLRRQGAGRALLDHILRVSRERGYQELFLETGCQPEFGPAQMLYRSAGFQECGPFGSYTENGNSVFMWLRLSEELARLSPDRLALTEATSNADRRQLLLERLDGQVDDPRQRQQQAQLEQETLD